MMQLHFCILHVHNYNCADFMRPVTKRCRNSGRERGEVKELGLSETYKKQRMVTSCACFCSETMLASQTTENLENLFVFFGSANSCNKFV